jgi:hypothetical protein
MVWIPRSFSFGQVLPQQAVWALLCSPPLFGRRPFGVVRHHDADDAARVCLRHRRTSRESLP